MPIQTNLSSSPYFDDFDENKNFYEILFKPGVAVQVREINQLQRILQSQIEKFGDNIFKRGTVIDGCNFTFLDKLSYAKLLDNDITGAPVNVSSFKNFYVKDSANLVGIVVETANGFESTAPDLNTIFLRFINSGTSFNKTKFDKNSILTVYNANNVVEKITVNDGGTSFSNTSDEVVIMSALAVQNSTGGAEFAANTWVVNSIIKDSALNARAEILEVNSTANSEALILKVRPLVPDLTNASSTQSLWTFVAGNTVVGNTYGATTANSSANGVIVGIVGTGAAASLLTDSTGKITTVGVTNQGSGYYVPPHISVFSNTGSVSSANLVAQNFLTRVTVLNDDTATGRSYGISVSDGVIYQKGFFVRVGQQLKIVEKYANTTTPDEKVVGFDTLESFVDYNEDPSLLDNALDTFNYTAPGADRLKLSPTLVVLTKSDADANNDFLPLVEFNKGNPFRQIRTTQYNKIQNEIAKRTFEESGNYVVDTFRSVTTSPTVSSEANTFEVVIDPGIAYISGNRVETVTSYIETLDKGVENTAITNVGIEVSYGNYVRINEVGGYFQFNTGDIVELYDTARLYTSNTEITGTVAAAAGTRIGYAKMKSLVYESGEPGSTAVYRLYLFDITMDSGKNFADVKSVYYNGTHKGYGDIVLERSGTSSSNVAVLQLSSSDTLIFDSGYKALANLTGVDYRYRSTNTSTTIAQNGNVSISVASGYLPYTGTLSSTEKSEVVVIPLANLETANVSTANVINTNNIIALSNGTFFNSLKLGDYVKIYDTSGSKIRRVVGTSTVAANGTAWSNSIVLNSIANLASSNVAANISFFVPQYSPLQLSTRPDRVANVNSNTTLRVYLNPPVNFTSASNVAVTYTAVRQNVSPSTKNTSRKTYVTLYLSNNAANTVGPWCLGVNDIFRLRNVYKHNASTVNVNSTNVTNEFFIDHNQTENKYDLGFLYKNPSSTLSLTSSDYLLVEFDAFTKTGDGIYSVDSYVKQDGAGNSSVTTLGQLTLSSSNVHTLEIPEMYTTRGTYFDLRDSLDFRINVSNTANLSTTVAGATINPAVATFSTATNKTTEKFFPAPETDITFDVVKYEGRTDMIVLNSNGSFQTIMGSKGVVNRIPTPPADSILINSFVIPPYPSLPENLSANTLEVLDKKVSNIKFTNERQSLYTIEKSVTNDNVQFTQPTVYRMSDIGSIDRRLKNIEYRIDLKDIEDEVKDRPIRSSVDATSNRFKFGFFVDNFTSTDFSELDDPEYSATNFNNRLTAIKRQLNVKHRFYTANTTTADLIYGRIATLPYEEYTVARQNSATTEVTTANTVVRQATASIEEVRRGGPNIWDQYVTFSTTAGTAKLYAGAFGSDRWEIYQSTAPFFTVPAAGTPLPSGVSLVTTSENAGALTDQQRQDLNKIKALPTSVTKGKWDIKLRPNVTFATKGGNSKYWIRNTGYISWSHDPSRGIYYLVRVIRGTPYHDYRLEYPVDAVVNVTQELGTPVKIAYNGRVKNLNPSKLPVYIKTNTYGWPYVYWNDRNVATVVNNTKAIPPSLRSTVDCVVNVTVKGLKPNTQHNFYFGDTLYNSQVTPTLGANKGVFGTNTTTGSTLVSDSYGNLEFKWFFSDDIPNSVSRTKFIEMQRQKVFTDITKVAQLKSLDETSFANWTVTVDYRSYGTYNTWWPFYGR